MSTEHTVLLLQFDEYDAQSRTYLDFDTVQDSMDAIAQIYENKIRLAQKRGNQRAAVEGGDENNAEEVVSYDMRGLVKFIEEDLAELTCLVFDETQKIYVPHGKEWIKSRLYMYLKKYATKETANE